jgi:hypothetical protein
MQVNDAARIPAPRRTVRDITVGIQLGSAERVDLYPYQSGDFGQRVLGISDFGFWNSEWRRDE